MLNNITMTTSRQKVARLSRLLWQSPTSKRTTTRTTHDTRSMLNQSPLATAANSSISSTQRFLSSTMTQTSSSSSSTSSTYVSPYQDLFEMMKDTTNSSGLSFVSSSCESSQNIPKLLCGIPETVLKFRTTCYDRLMLAPYVQPSEYKVILQVKMKHLPLETDAEKEIFYQIVGKRFNHESQELKLTSNQFASRIENKRHLCWMLDRIVMGAKNLARDSF